MFTKRYFGLIFTLVTIFSIWWKEYYKYNYKYNYQHKSMQPIILIFGDDNFHIQIERIALASYYSKHNTILVINNQFIDVIDIYMDQMAMILNTSTVIDTMKSFHIWYQNNEYLSKCHLDIIIICNESHIEEIVDINNLYYNGTNNMMRIIAPL